MPCLFENDPSNRWAVVTTINAPTPEFSSLVTHFESRIVVVGDVKTPDVWENLDVVFVPIGHNDKLSALLPRNHYSRKNLGYIEALRRGATEIFDTDDDNELVSLTTSLKETRLVSGSNGWVNPYQFFSTEDIWPRGFPLDEIRNSNYSERRMDEPVRPGVAQFLANRHPDVDAIFRLTRGEEFFFEKGNPIVVARDDFAPTNSQATLFSAEVAPLMYIPATVNFRFSDILRGFVLAPILHQRGWHLVFPGVGVVQNRNIHDLMDDFRDEITMYTQTAEVVEVLSSTDFGIGSISDAVRAAYSKLAEKSIVNPKEITILDAWLDQFS